MQLTTFYLCAPVVVLLIYGAIPIRVGDGGYTLELSVIYTCIHIHIYIHLHTSTYIHILIRTESTRAQRTLIHAPTPSASADLCS